MSHPNNTANPQFGFVYRPSVDDNRVSTNLSWNVCPKRHMRVKNQSRKIMGRSNPSSLPQGGSQPIVSQGAIVDIDFKYWNRKSLVNHISPNAINRIQKSTKIFGFKEMSVWNNREGSDTAMYSIQRRQVEHQRYSSEHRAVASLKRSRRQDGGDNILPIYQ